MAFIKAAQDAGRTGSSQGYVEDLKDNDKYLYGLLSAPGITYYSMFLVPGDKLPIAFLVVAYDENQVRSTLSSAQLTLSLKNYAIAKKLSI